ncbi:hypothetical protein Ddye_020314 [Dipteronia dyeriana]|uniref:Bet v I/Major latex protein domain-containing protein n=1 Tax=Dipteronia dyeriana TaxID=168575 RepID=A0AAD9WV94_9ROSI|nr:hypothetical protein Ddye_020314 [Dipteronia dyeriana]
MGVICVNNEHATPVAPARMFKALILDSHNLVPKLVKKSIKSIDVIEGDGEEVGCIKQANFCEGDVSCGYMRHRIDALDKDNFLCNDGGCLVKVATEFHVKGGDDHHEVLMMEQNIKEGQELEIGMLKVIETHLLKIPEDYA